MTWKWLNMSDIKPSDGPNLFGQFCLMWFSSHLPSFNHILTQQRYFLVLSHGRMIHKNWRQGFFCCLFDHLSLLVNFYFCDISAHLEWVMRGCEAASYLSVLNKDRHRETCISITTSGCSPFPMCWDRGMNKISFAQTQRLTQSSPSTVWHLTPWELSVSTAKDIVSPWERKTVTDTGRDSTNLSPVHQWKSITT